MKIDSRFIGSVLIVFLLVGGLGIGQVQAAPEKESKRKPVDQDPDVLFARIKRSLEGYDMNNEEKYLIQDHFSSMHAMSAYRELLLWSMTYPKDDPLRQDIVSLVRGSMVAVFRDSGAGVPLSGWAGAGQPISMAYWQSTPRYVQTPNYADLSTLKWDATDQEKNKKVTPATIGQSLAAKSLLIMVDRSPEGEQIGPLMLASALQELEILGHKLFLKEALGAVTDGAYVPDVLAIDAEGKWQVLDKDSSLFFQASLLRGLVAVHELLLAEDVILPLFADGPVLGKSLAEWQKLTRKCLDQVYATIISNHFDEKLGSFASGYKPGKGHNKRILLEDLGVLDGALNALIHVLPEADPKRQSARKHLLAQAAFIKDAVGERASIAPKGYMLTNKVGFKSLLPMMLHSISVMSLQLSAEELQPDQGYDQVISDIYDAVQKVYWSEPAGIYRSTGGTEVSAYDGHVFGAMLGWLRRMQQRHPDLGDFNKYGVDFVSQVLKNGGLMQSEGPDNGELRAPADYLTKEVPPLVRQLEETEVGLQAGPILELLKKAADQDGDRVPGIHFVGGEFGAAPVIIMRTSVSTPFPVVEKKDKAKADAATEGK